MVQKRGALLLHFLPSPSPSLRVSRLKARICIGSTCSDTGSGRLAGQLSRFCRCPTNVHSLSFLFFFSSFLFPMNYSSRDTVTLTCTVGPRADNKPSLSSGKEKKAHFHSLNIATGRSNARCDTTKLRNNRWEGPFFWLTPPKKENRRICTLLFPL